MTMRNETKNNLECPHKWIPLLGRVGRKNIATSLFTCLKCGDLKVGTRTIKISRYRLDMGNKPIRLGTTAGIADDHTVSGLTFTFTATANSAFGDVGYVASTGSVSFIDADAIATCSGIVMCADATISAAASGNWLVHGMARDDTWNWTVGGLIYASTTGTTGNTLTQTAPSGTDDVIQVIGVALSADVLYFNPQLIQVEHV